VTASARIFAALICQTIKNSFQVAVIYLQILACMFKTGYAVVIDLDQIIQYFN